MTEPDEQLFAIQAGHFYAGLVVKDNRITRPAPILHYMLGWPMTEVRRYCRNKGWIVISVPRETDGR
jgi:hypothetical protein